MNALLSITTQLTSFHSCQAAESLYQKHRREGRSEEVMRSRGITPELSARLDAARLRDNTYEKYKRVFESNGGKLTSKNLAYLLRENRSGIYSQIKKFVTHGFVVPVEVCGESMWKWVG